MSNREPTRPTRDRVLITGATGLLGRHLVQQLGQHGYSLRVLVRKKEQQALFPGIEVALGDIRNANEVRAAVKGCRYIFHACSTHVYNLPAEEMYAVNVAGTQNVCDAAELNECERLIFTSTVSSLLDAPPATLTSASSPRKGTRRTRK